MGTTAVDLYFEVGVQHIRAAAEEVRTCYVSFRGLKQKCEIREPLPRGIEPVIWPVLPVRKHYILQVHYIDNIPREIYIQNIVFTNDCTL